MLILIGGKKQHGKNTMANAIRQVMLDTPELTQLPYMNMHWADTLKGFLVNIGVLTQEQAWGTEEQKNTFTNVQWANMPSSIQITYRSDWPQVVKDGKIPNPYLTAREVMQIYGTDIIRGMFNDQAWVESLGNKAQDFFKRFGTQAILTVPDTRFKNELAIKDSFETLSIYMIKDGAPESTDTHASENAVGPENFDLSYTCSDLRDIRYAAETVVQEHILRKVKRESLL